MSMGLVHRFVLANMVEFSVALVYFDAVSIPILLSQEFTIFIHQIDKLPFQHSTAFTTLSSEHKVLDFDHLVHMFKVATGYFAPHGHTPLQHIAMVDTFISEFDDFWTVVFVGIVRHSVVEILTPTRKHRVMCYRGAGIIFSS